MVMDLFESIMNEFGKVIGLDLHPDKNQACLIQLPNDGPAIQIELDKTGNFVVLVSNIGFIPPGRYRETVFKEALRVNNQPHPRNGTFAYSKKADQLVLLEQIPVKDINGEKLASVYTPFTEKAAQWKEAITHGEVPQGTTGSTRRSGTGMFGL